MKCMIIDMVYRKGNTTEAYMASICVNDKKLKIIYDAINDRLIIHRWYVLTKEEQKSVQAEMSEYFKLVKRFNEKLKSIRDFKL